MENKEIKFRAWDKYQKKMLDWADITDPMKLTLSNLLNGLIEHLKPMQYTGLKDKNGKEGYYQDIINHTVYGRGVIEWYSNGWAIHLESMYGYEGWMEFEIIEKSEIIGNIYEHPELIKQLNEA